MDITGNEDQDMIWYPVEPLTHNPRSMLNQDQGQQSVLPMRQTNYSERAHTQQVSTNSIPPPVIHTNVADIHDTSGAVSNHLRGTQNMGISFEQQNQPVSNLMDTSSTLYYPVNQYTQPQKQYYHQLPNPHPQSNEETYLSQLWDKRRSAFKTVIITLIVLLAISLHWAIIFYVQMALDHVGKTPKPKWWHDVALRVSYPILVFFLIWNMKTFV